MSVNRSVTVPVDNLDILDTVLANDGTCPDRDHHGMRGVNRAEGGVRTRLHRFRRTRVLSHGTVAFAYSSNHRAASPQIGRPEGVRTESRYLPLLSGKQR